MFLYFRKDKLVLHDLFVSMPTDAHKVQLGSNLVEVNTRLGGIDFVQVKATINLATTHREACAGTTSIEQLKNQFRTRQGYFVVNLCGTNLNLNFLWKEVMDFSNDVYFFGPPLASSRYCSNIFRKNAISLVSYMKQIFRDLARETVGDALASHALYHAYLDLLLDLIEKEAAQATKKTILL